MYKYKSKLFLSMSRVYNSWWIKSYNLKSLITFFGQSFYISDISSNSNNNESGVCVRARFIIAIHKCKTNVGQRCTWKSIFLWYVVVVVTLLLFFFFQFSFFFNQTFYLTVLLMLRGGLCNRTQTRTRSTRLYYVYRIGLIRWYYLRRTPL